MLAVFYIVYQSSPRYFTHRVVLFLIIWMGPYQGYRHAHVRFLAYWPHLMLMIVFLPAGHFCDSGDVELLSCQRNESTFKLVEEESAFGDF
ncbi:hypothetical protein BD779DRAFT_463636 [Infundibulicybe gibba]|nr:hypothetical protein BD779DRAFT_463636 [Infundibulicybe gibba]